MDDQTRPNSLIEYSLPLSSSLETVLEEGSDQSLRRVIHNQFSAGSMLEERRSIMGKRLGITGGQYQILMVISRLQGTRGVAIKDVALQLRVVVSHVTVEIGKLAKWGFVEKIPNENDGRSVLIALTKRGIAAIETVTPTTRGINDGLFDGFTKAYFQYFDGLLDYFVSNSEKTLATTLYENEISERLTAVKR